MGSSEKFCLRWNDFETNISVAFRELREEKDFFDVTLACDDSQVQAHKVILSACSPFFRQVLRKNPHQHPLLYLKGVKYKELLSVLNFMYMGEVNVAQEELNSFLAVAEDLRVKGLTQNNSSDSSSHKETKSEPSRSAPPPRARSPPSQRDPGPPPKRPRPTPPPPPAPSHHNNSSRQSYGQEEDDDIQEVVPVKSEPRDPPPTSTSMSSSVDDNHAVQQYGGPATPMAPPGAGTVALDDTYGADDSYDYGQYGDDSMSGYDDAGGMIDPNTGMPIAGAGGADGNKGWEVDALIASKMERLETGEKAGEWKCKLCDFVHKYKQRTSQHIESRHISSEGNVCEICFKNCPTRNALRVHKFRNHRASNFDGVNPRNFPFDRF